MASAAGTVAQDARFYKQDGNVVLRAEQTLFKVHRSILSELSPVLSDMLALPVGDHAEVEGLDDEHPIVFADDTAEELRSLLWALYARPDEVSKFLAPRVHDAQCRRLLHIATLCHKYDCSDLLAWALEQAQSNCKSRWGVQCIFSPSLPTIACLVQLHARGVSGLAQWAEPCIRLSIEKDRSTLLAVVRMTGLSSWSSLEAYAYYRLVCLGMADSLSLSVTEQTRLLAGYHNLTELWAKISTARLDMAHACPPAFQADCEANCIGLWHDLCTASTTCASSSLVDLVGRMGWINTASTKALKDGGFVAAAVADVPQRLVNSAAACWSNLRCRKAFRAGVKAVADEMERNALYCMGTGAGLIDHASCTLPLAPAPSLSLGRGRASM